MKIEFVLDEVEENSTDLLGNIKISDDSQNSIFEETTYIDSWVCALEEAIKQLVSNKYVSVDLVDEPDYLIFERKKNSVSISYKDMKISANSLDEVQLALKSMKDNLEQIKL